MSDSLEGTIEYSNYQINDNSPILSSIKWLIAGGFGGASAVLVGHPFDLVKVRLQTGKKGLCTGSFDVFKDILKKRGFFGLYQGFIPPLLGTVPIIAVTFCGYDFGKFLVKKISGVSSDLSIHHIMFAGVFSAFPATFVTTPFERVKIILQIQGQHKENRFNGVGDVLKHLYKTGGIKSVFKGGYATLARDAPGSAIYFGVYEAMKRYMIPDNSEKLSLGTTIVAGGFAGIATWSIVFPMDTIKSYIQGSDKTNVKSLFTTLYRQGGISRLYPGFGTAMLRSFPANSATFLGVELAYKILDKLF